MEQDSEKANAWRVISRTLIGCVCIVQKVTGSLLGAAAVTLQAGNILICILILISGPAVVIKMLAR